MCAVFLLPKVIGSLWRWARHLGGPGLVLLGIADNTPFVSAPAGSVDIAIILLSAANRELWGYYALMATIGEVTGAYLTYRLAAKGGRETLERKVGERRAERIYKQFEKRGYLTLLAGSILPPPFPFTSLLVAAGVMQYPRRKFLTALTFGRALRFFTVAFLGRTYGRQVAGLFSQHYQPMLYITIALALISGIGFLVYLAYRPSGASHKTE